MPRRCYIAGLYRYRSVGRVEQYFVIPIAGVLRQAEQDDDRELQAFGGVHGHYAYRVIVRFGDGHLGDAGVFLLPAFRPDQEPPQGEGRCAGRNGAVILQIAGLLYQELAAAPGFPRAGFGQVQLVQAAVADEGGDQLGYGFGAAPLVILPQLLHPVPYRWRRLPLVAAFGSIGIQPAGLVVPDGGVAAGIAPAQQVGIGAGEGGGAQGGDYGHFVRRVVNGAQAVEQILHFLRVKKEGCPFQAVGDGGIVQGAGQNAQAVAAAD